MSDAQLYAKENRVAIANIIFRNMEWKIGRQFHTIHNYIDTECNILRKGAVSAEYGEKATKNGYALRHTAQVGSCRASRHSTR